MHPLIEIVAAVAFVASSGLFFNQRFRGNYLAVGIAGTIATLSTYFLLQELPSKLFGRKADSEVFIPRYKPGEGPFTIKTLDQISAQGLANVCSRQCDGDDFTMFRLPIDNTSFSRRIFLVTTHDQGYCGSGGCSDMIVLIEERKRPVILYEGHGTSDRPAMIIAREALQRL